MLLLVEMLMFIYMLLLWVVRELSKLFVKSVDIKREVRHELPGNFMRAISHSKYGIDGADVIVKTLKCIWISHIHADQHTGLARILALRRDLLKGMPHEPVLVVGSRLIKGYLDAYQRLEDLDMLFLDCNNCTVSLDAFDDIESDKDHGFPGSPVNSQDANNNKISEIMASKVDSTLFSGESCMQSYWKKSDSPVDKDMVSPIMRKFKKAIQEASLETLISFPIVHCPQAFGVVLKASERVNSVGQVIPGWKIVYSGDTRPCPELVEASRDATVLIHGTRFL